jgi:hypothetical protein
VSWPVGLRQPGNRREHLPSDHRFLWTRICAAVGGVELRERRDQAEAARPSFCSSGTCCAALVSDTHAHPRCAATAAAGGLWRPYPGRSPPRSRASHIGSPRSAGGDRGARRGPRDRVASCRARKGQPAARGARISVVGSTANTTLRVSVAEADRFQTVTSGPLRGRCAGSSRSVRPSLRNAMFPVCP